MPKAGRPRKPSQELKLSGTFNKVSSRKTWNTETPNQLDYKPAPGRYLKRTQIAWNQFMRVKCVQGILSEEDESLVVVMFDNLDDVYRMQDKIDEFYRSPDLSEKLEDDSTRKQLKEMVQIRKIHEVSFVNLACRFGLTPSERSKLSVNNGKPLSPLMKLLAEEA